MEKFQNYNIAHLTLSPHVFDENSFKTKVQPFIINWITTKSTITYYSISEERGKKDHHHLDILIFSKSIINTNILNKKGNQLNLQGEVQKLIKSCPSTIWDRFWNYKGENKKKSPVHNRKYLIGYNQKETEKNSELKNYNNLDISESELSECIEYYELNKDDKEVEDDNDVIPLHPKNAMYLMSRYIEKEKPETFDRLISSTVKQGYCWLGMSKTVCRRLLLQLKLKYGHSDQHEVDEMDDWFQNETTDEQIQSAKYMTHLQRLSFLRSEGLINKEELIVLQEHYKK